ncbi:hypothetical protein BWR17_09680 [Phaeobacter inhibens]|nr:hypothetical protein BWR17_09680 [Phaeobacter inhibens]
MFNILQIDDDFIGRTIVIYQLPLIAVNMAYLVDRVYSQFKGVISGTTLNDSPAPMHIIAVLRVCLQIEGIISIPANQKVIATPEI